MTPRRLAACLPLALLLCATTARAELYSYLDAEGQWHFTNVPTEARYKRVRTNDVAGVYQPSPGSGSGSNASRSANGAQATPRRCSAYQEHIRGAADRYNLPEALIHAVMEVESNCNHKALSDKGAMGLMQLMPGTAREMYVQDAWLPEENIEGGARYLRLLANQYSGDLTLTLAAYNAGPDAVRRAGAAIPNIPETQEYVRKVVALYKALKGER
jgi:soluble lytic murein transglycosylase-like protein